MDTQRLPKKEEDDYQPSSTIESMNAFSQDQHNYSMDDFDSILDLNIDGSKCSQQLIWDFFKEDGEDEEEKRLSTDQEGSSSGVWDNMSAEYEDKELGLKLNLNHQEVIDAWSDRRQQPLWTDNANLMAPTSAVYSGEVPVMDEERNTRREASVLRYKEKRQSRLFSKKIRYQVRKLNADKRPRFKKKRCKISYKTKELKIT
ncbi:zinc finger protein CONSTANS-LIKE 7 isoform X2 [Raphanus sativus]|uniref:Zinc finger protein CONSTANS-LIKE 7 isoform X2 n=1 Tax=Raphanus sativus TaxID=3726 RepID=A0A9W3C9X1_RAPSA|nr:zinc finger protein CONSTANS-LIKE 7 isoform X2 [Raphanus sativus]